MTLHGVDAFVEVVRQRTETEGLRPFSMRTGIPIGQLRSVVQGRAARYTTLQSIASVMGMRLFSAPAEPGGMEAPPLPPELTRALGLPSDASVIDAVDAIDQDAVASKLRRGMRLVQKTTELATAAAELLPQVAGGSRRRRRFRSRSTSGSRRIPARWRSRRYCQMLCCARPSLERGDGALHGAPKPSVRPGGSRIPPGKGWPPAGTECCVVYG